MIDPILKPILVYLTRKGAGALILSSILTEEGQPLLTEEGALIQVEIS